MPNEDKAIPFTILPNNEISSFTNPYKGIRKKQNIDTKPIKRNKGVKSICNGNDKITILL